MLAIATACSSAMAQTDDSKLPNGDFEGTWSACIPWTSNGYKKSMNKQPESWTVSNVSGANGTGATNVGEHLTPGRGGQGNAVTIYNVANEYMSSQVVPGYITLGTTWSTSKGTFPVTNKDGGTFGGISFKYKPDALRFYYKRSCRENNVRSSVVAYLWNGSTTQKYVPGNISLMSSPKKVTMTDRDINVLKMSTSGHQGGAVTDKSKLIAKLEAYTTDTPSDWTEWTIPFEYTKENIDKTPEKINVIIAANDYFNSSNVTAGVSMSIDDVELVYYKTLSSLKVNGTDIELKDGTYVYNGTGSISEGCVKATAKSQFAKVDYKYNTDNVVITVTANNGETQEYKVNFASSVTPPNAADIDGKYNNAIAVRLGSESVDATYSFNEVTISANSDNTVNFILKGFAFGGTEIGNVNVANVPISWSGENVALSCKKNIDIEVTNPEAEGMGLKNLPMVLNAEVNTSKELTAKLQITWTGLPIYVAVEKQPFTYSISNSQAIVSDGTIDDESIKVIQSLASTDQATSIDLSNVDVTASNFESLVENMTNIVFYVGNNDLTGTNIVKNGTAESLNLIDYDAPFGIPQGFTANEVSYDRTLTTEGDYVSSFILPFAFDVPEGTTVAELSAVNGNTLTFKPVTRTEANKPYIIITNDENVLSTFSNVTVEATNDADLTTTVDGVKHIGSYTTKKVENVYGYANGKFVKANTGTVNPFRTYIEMPNTASAPKAFNISIEGTTTGINHANATNATATSIYNLQGIRMSNDLNGLSKGVYIVNGKKVIK